MNRFIKRTMILALALAMSLGAWAQQERLLTTVTHNGQSSYIQSPDGIVTVTLNNISNYSDNYGWIEDGTVTVQANQGYTITRCVFRQNDKTPLEDGLAPFTATMVSYSVFVETSNGQEYSGDMDGITSIEVYGYAADPSPTVTFNAADSSWGFTMPGYNAALNVTYKALPNLTWFYGTAAMPAEGLTVTRGFHADAIQNISLQVSDMFNTAMRGSHELAPLSAPWTWETNIDYISAADMANFVDNSSLTEEQALAIPNPFPTDLVYIIYGFDGNAVKYIRFEGGTNNVNTASAELSKSTIYSMIHNVGAKYYYTTSAFGPGLTLRYGSSDPAVVSFINANDMTTFSLNGPGTATVYAVFDGNDDFLRDSASFTVNILNPDTLTLSANGNGTVSPLLGGGNATWTTETWADQTANQNLSPFTIGDITLTATANGTISKVESSGKLYFFIRKNNDEETLTFSSNGGNFSRIEMTCNNSNPFGGVDQEGWTVTPIDGGGSTAVWEGDAASVTFASCTTLVSQINFYRAGNSDIVASTTEGRYLVIHGATVQAVAEAQDGNYVQAWSDNRQPGNYTSDTNTITVNETKTLTATFAQNPLLTLATSGQGTGTVEFDGYTPGIVYNITFDHEGTDEGDRSFTIPASRMPYDTTFSYNDIIDDADAYDQMGESVSKISQDAHTVTIRISGAFEYGGYYHCEFAGGIDDWSITCEAGIGQVYPDGIAATETENTYRVLPGTTVNVTATPAEGSYLAQWSDGTQTEPVEGDARLGGSHPYTMPAAPATLTATFNEIPVLTLEANNSQWGSVKLDGVIPGPTTYDITIDGNTVTNVSFPYTTTVFLHDGLEWVETAEGDQYPLSVSKNGNNAVINISAPYDGARTILYEYFYDNEPWVKNKNIICRALQGAPTTPEGVTYVGYNNYLVLPGTQVKVIATPDSAHYFVNWDEETALNSNTAVEKTLTMGTAPATLTANFAAKPVLTLAQNESQWGTVSVNGPVVWNNQVWGSWDYFNTTFPQTIGDITINKNNFYCYYSSGKLLLDRSANSNNPNVTFTSAGDNFTRIEMTYTGGTNLEPANEWTCANGVAVWEGNAQSVTITNANDFYITQIKFTRGSGIEQLTDNTYRVDYGTEVTVQADAAELHHVSGWQDQGGTELTGATYSDYFITTPQNLFPAKSAVTLTVTGNTTARALFGINSYDVTATVAESDDVRGTVSAAYTDPQGAQQSAAAGASLTLTAQGGSTTTLTATPQTGYHFVQWIDQNNPGTTSTQNPLTMTEAGSYTAVFDTNVYQISGSVATASSQWGSVTGSGEYRHFTTATLTAMPIEHYHFVQWEDGNTENPRTIDVTGEESHQAEFAIDRFTVSWSSNDETMGVVVGPYDNHTTGNPIPRLQGAYGTTFQLTASPAEHHMLDHWSTGQTTNVITVTITEDAEIVANFKHVPYSVSVASADETMGTVSGSQESVEWHASTEISATANYGYHFVQWNDGNTANPRTVTINEEHDYSFTALFAKNQYTVTVVTGDATRGSVSGTTTVDYLTDVEISATANEHYHFEQWNDGNMQNPRTVTVTANATYRAYFAPDKYTVTGLADQGQGSVTGSGSYAYLSNATLTAEPACGYLFDHWSNESTESTITFQVTGEMSYTAFFRPAVVETVEIHDTVTVTETVTVHDTTYIDIHDSIDVTVHVHDTTIVEVPVYVHDTTTVTVTDTVEVEVPVEVLVHDTTFVNVPVHDTVYVSDGTIIYVHDTTTVEVPVNVYVHDTTTIEVQVPVYVHDTTTIEVQVPVYVYDTTTVYDTTVVEVPVHDTTTVTEYVHDTVEVTVIVHDTIFIHDTIFVGIEGVDALDAKIYGHNGQIVVEGADFNEVILFDVNGRILARRQDEGLPLRFDIPASGAYLVKIGNHAARRIVMIR